jgi:hypothetical protein
MNKNDILKVDPNSLHPTQFCLGYKEIEHKEKIIQKMTPEEYDKYLVKKTTPVVIGANNTMYLIDHHHHARSLINLNKSLIIVKVVENLSSLDENDFIKRMIDLKFVNLFNEEGKTENFKDLPKTLKSMKHDYFRSLAWSVRDNNGFKKVDEIPFFEFRWGEYFRKYIKEELIKDHFALATEIATKLSKEETAKHLPGFLSKN